MPCASFGVKQLLVGLHRVGVVGLRDAFERADTAGIADSERLRSLLVESLLADNYVPASMAEPFRTAVWREYLRYRGEDFSAFFSEVAVTVRGRPGEERDHLLELLTPVLAELELAPVVTLAPAAEGQPGPELLIGDRTTLRGRHTRDSLKKAVRESLSDW